MYTIYGASDDLVEIEGQIRDEIDCYDKAVLITIGDLDTYTSDDKPEGVHIIMRYAPDWLKAGVWSAEVAPIDEDIDIPWPVSIKLGGRGYSAEVTVDCPDDTPITWKTIPMKL